MRHPLVQKIILAYEKNQKSARANARADVQAKIRRQRGSEMIAIHTQNRSGIRFSRTLLEKIKKTIRTAVEAEYPNHTFELNIFFCDDETIRSYNREYRGVDRATDVLSFPMFDFGTPELPAAAGRHRPFRAARTGCRQRNTGTRSSGRCAFSPRTPRCI